MKEEKTGWLNEFLWFCAGVHRGLLRRCPTDHAKYAGMGGTILATALLASLSGGFALFTVFKTQTAAIFFGIFWGFVIFNLDRFIVSTMHSDGKANISGREIMSALPRLIIAVFLGIIIAHPLKLRVFEREIGYEIEQLKNEKASDAKLTELKNEFDALRIDRDNYEHSKTDLRKSSTADYNTVLGDRINELNREMEQTRKTISSYDNQLHAINRNIQNIVATGEEAPQNLLTQSRNVIQQKSLSVSQLNRLISDKKRMEGEVIGDMNSEMKRIDDRIANTDNLIKLKEQEISAYQTEIRAVTDTYDGYAARMEAFTVLRNKKLGVDIAAWFITLLFIIIEVAPTLFKLMIPSGCYDDLLRAEKHRTKMLTEKMISEANDKANTAIALSAKSSQIKIDSELLTNEKLIKEIADVQHEIMLKAIEKWKEIELAKAESNPEDYIKASL